MQNPKDVMIAHGLESRHSSFRNEHAVKCDSYIISNVKLPRTPEIQRAQKHTSLYSNHHTDMLPRQCGFCVK